MIGSELRDIGSARRRIVKQREFETVTNCPFLEIYNEQIMDLLEPSSTNLYVIHMGTFISKHESRIEFGKT